MTIDMDDLMDAIVAGQSPSQVSDAIKDLLYAKSADKVDAMKASIAHSVFNPTEDEIEVDEPIEEPEATIEKEDQE